MACSAPFGGFIFAVGNAVRAGRTTTAPSSTFFAYAVLILGGAARILGPIVGSIIFWAALGLHRRLPRPGRSAAGVIPTWIMDTQQVGAVRFMLVGLGLMLLMIFRPQGIFGDKREMALDAR